jgi:hypothetical protein
MSFMAIGHILWRLVRAIVPPLFGIIVRVPWMIVVSLTIVVRGLRRGAGFPGRLLAASRDVAICARCGRGTRLLGTYRCPVCKGTETTHAWAPCTICGTKTPAGYIACTTLGCGESIVNPMLRGIR